MFEDRINQRQFKPRVLIRKGSFIGVYRYCFKTKLCLLTFKISLRSSPVPSFEVHEEGPYEKDGKSIFESSLVEADEVHFIPVGYDLRCKKDRDILRKCLGGCYLDVQRKLFLSMPNEFNLRFNW
jgi:hypothetical protein